MRTPRGGIPSASDSCPPCPSSASSSFDLLLGSRPCGTGQDLAPQPFLQASVVVHPRGKLVPPPRFEHGTHRLGICCSILLSYGGTIRLSNEYRVVGEAVHFLPQQTGTKWHRRWDSALI